MTLIPYALLQSHPQTSHPSHHKTCQPKTQITSNEIRVSNNGFFLRKWEPVTRFTRISTVPSAVSLLSTSYKSVRNPARSHRNAVSELLGSSNRNVEGVVWQCCWCWLMGRKRRSVNVKQRCTTRVRSGLEVGVNMKLRRPAATVIQGGPIGSLVLCLTGLSGLFQRESKAYLLPFLEQERKWEISSCSAFRRVCIRRSW